ncbi:hypothetical protein C3R26_21080, partial [Mycobacterium tuberculosis]
DSLVALSVVPAARRRGLALRARLLVACAPLRALAAALASAAAWPAPAPAAGAPIPVLPPPPWLSASGA